MVKDNKQNNRRKQLRNVTAWETQNKNSKQYVRESEPKMEAIKSGRERMRQLQYTIANITVLQDAMKCECV